MTKSQLFTQYNRARAAAYAGKLDLARVNRALGLVQAKEARPYHTSIRICDCPDQVRHPDMICKHRIAKMLEYRAEQEKEQQ